MKTITYELLSLNQNQSASEIQSGIRAEYIPSPLTRRLANWKGRAMARTLMMLGVSEKIFNYMVIRPYALMTALRQAIEATNHTMPVVIDPAAGFGPQYIWLADEMPDVQFIEIDHPDVIREKEAMLAGYPLASGIELRGVDLASEPLETALGGIRPNVITAMAAYMTKQQFVEVLRYLSSVIAPDGWVIAPFPNKQGIDDLSRNSLIFKRLAKTKPIGMIDSDDVIYTIMEEAGYRNTQLIKLSDVAHQMDKAIPADIETFALAQVPDISRI